MIQTTTTQTRESCKSTAGGRSSHVLVTHRGISTYMDMDMDMHMDMGHGEGTFEEVEVRTF